jgi:hypothetical protein
MEVRREPESDSEMSFSKRAIAVVPELEAIQGISAVSRIGWVKRDALWPEASRKAIAVESSVAILALAPTVARLSFSAP